MPDSLCNETRSQVFVSKFEDELKFLLKDDQQLRDVYSFVRKHFKTSEEKRKRQTDRYLDDGALTLHGNGTSLRIRQLETGSCTLDIKMKFVGPDGDETHVYKRREAKKTIDREQRDALLRGGSLELVVPEYYHQLCDMLSLPSIALSTQFDVIIDRQELAVTADGTSISFNFDTIQYAFGEQLSKTFYELEITYATELTSTPDIVNALKKNYLLVGWSRSKYDRGIYLLGKLHSADKTFSREEIIANFNLTPLQVETLDRHHEILNRVYQEFLFHKPYLAREERRILNELQVLLYDHGEDAGPGRALKKYVHSIRTRVKRAEHLIAKIVRKEGKYFEDEVTVTKGIKEKCLTDENYPAIITDLIGVRILHLFKDNWLEIDQQLSAIYQDTIVEKKFYVRKGDEIQGQNLRELVEAQGFEFEEKESGYRSAHYLIKREIYVDSGEKIDTYAEIQVRTVFEEAWGEVDHEIRYPYFEDDKDINQLLKTLNRIVGGADEMATFIKSYRDTKLSTSEGTS